jgi:hypothetical protein
VRIGARCGGRQIHLPIARFALRGRGNAAGRKAVGLAGTRDMKNAVTPTGQTIGSALRDLLPPEEVAAAIRDVFPREVIGEAWEAMHVRLDRRRTSGRGRL